MPTYIHGKNAALIHGVMDLSPWTREAKAKAVLAPADTSHFGSNSKTFITGQNDGTFTFSGMYDGNKLALQGVTGINEYLAGVVASDQAGGLPYPIALAPEGISIGAAALTGLAKQTTYEIDTVVSDIESINGDIQISGGFNYGDFLSTTTPISASTNFTAADDLVSSNKGAFITLHILSNTLTGSSSYKIQHSVDNSTWVDLYTSFSSVATITKSAQTGTIATGTTINRYLRLVATLAGTGAVSVVATAARN